LFVCLGWIGSQSNACELDDKIAKPIKCLCFGEFLLHCGIHYERKFSHTCVFAWNFSHFARRGIRPLDGCEEICGFTWCSIGKNSLTSERSERVRYWCWHENINPYKFFVCLHGDKTYNSFVCGNTT
jgi:hypothetical protein